MKFYLVYLIFLVILNLVIDELVGREETVKNLFWTEDLSSYPPYIAHKEIQVYKIIKSFSLENNQIEAIKKYILDFEESGLNLKSDLNEAVEFTKNPLAVYRMTRRFVKEYKSVENILEIFNDTERLEEIKKIKEKLHGFPIPEDFSDVMTLLLTFQDFYDLKAKDLAKGKLLQTETKVKLHRRHCFEISEYALKIKHYTLALDWLDAAEEIKDLTWKNLSKEEIKKLGDEIITQHDNDWEKKTKKNHKHIFQTKLRSLEIIKLDKSLRKNKELLWDKYVGNFTTKIGQQMEFNFMALCKGTKLRKPKDEQSLYCWLDTKRGAYWRINPLKIELVNKDPYLILIHSVIMDSWTKKCIQMSWDIKTNTYEALNKDILSNIPIHKRYELLFNLKVDKVHKFRIKAPSAALLYPHIDKGVKGDRIMVSTLLYIHPAEIGGETAFPFLGLSVKGPAGSILMWYNTLMNGEWDSRMVHGGCPIVFGHKWLATAPILKNAHFLQRPCALDKTL